MRYASLAACVYEHKKRHSRWLNARLATCPGARRARSAPARGGARPCGRRDTTPGQAAALDTSYSRLQ